MSDQPAETTAIATRPSARELRVVESVSPIMDTARFEHLGRVATVMARAGLLPESLCTYKGKDADGREVALWHDFEVIQARAFLIANQADLWKADPNAVAQCTSLIHGKLKFEGKLVHGIIETRLGIRLKYEFGRYILDKRDIEVGEMPKGDDQALGVRVSGQFPDEDFVRTIAGSVGMWHTGSKGPWNNPANWPRQLRYRGAPEWARAHSPGLLLGIMTDDEIDEARGYVGTAETKAPKVGKGRLAAKLNAPAQAPEGAERAEANGFSADHVASELDKGAEVIETQVVTPHDPATGEVFENLNDPETTTVGEVDLNDWLVAEEVAGPAPRGEHYTLQEDEVDAETNTLPLYMDGVQIGTIGPAESGDYNAYEDHAPTDEEHAAAGGDMVVEGDVVEEGFPGDQPVPKGTTAFNHPADEWEVLKDVDGPAPAGEQYLLAGDFPDTTTLRLTTYKDGAPFSSTSKIGAAKLMRYSAHTPAAPAKANKAPAKEKAAAPPPQEDTPATGAFADFWAFLKGAEAWLPIKEAFATMNKADEWKALPLGAQDEFRAKVWTEVAAKIGQGKFTLDPASDLTAFRMWIEIQEGTAGADAIEANFRALKREAVFENLKPDRQAGLRETVERKLAKLRGL